ncbi:junctophilin-2 isoform X3 [Galleria mellonella]|uniref:Junctophilin-2 isoform X3 n=1 Tax=Galleria mellonella TaxID=7137 RepID=A0A6J3BT90_GALME|nr:junctophilin-2 isoform X3 [Galleria mellonella]
MQPSELADTAHAASGNPPQRGLNGGRFDFDDGGTYCGGWEDGKAHGHGVCTGPKGQGAYAGSWHFGFEVSGVYTWPSGSSYEGQWQNGKRHGLGVETRDRWLYRGEWTQGYKGRYGVRQSTTSNAKYEGTWANGLQDGYGSETYADGGTYQGQWMRGLRHGYGVRTSAPFGLASHYRGGARHGHRGSLSSLTEAAGTPDPSERRTTRMDDARGGFVLKASSDEPGRRGSLVEKTKKGLLSKLRKQRSAGELDKRGTGSVRSGGSGGSGSSWVSSVESSHSAMTHASLQTNSNASFVVEDEHLDASVTETYMGEWKNDKRTGFGVSERSDGLRYEGEWFGNRKYGYGVTTFRDGTREEGKYKNNVLITSQKRKHMFLMRSAKFRERVDSAVNAAQRASKIALQKGDIAISRTATARGKAEQADEAADQAKDDCDNAQATAKQFAPDFKHPGFDRIGLREKYRQKAYDTQITSPVSQESEKILDGKSIPNHIPPMHSQLPQSNKVPNAIPSRRPSTQHQNTQYPKPVDPRLVNNANYNTDNRALGPPYDQHYNPNQDNWSSANTQSQIPDNQKSYLPNEINTYGPISPSGPQAPQSAYRLNRQDALQGQQCMDQSSQQYINQGRRLSSAIRQTPNQRPQQEWNTTQIGPRRQSVLAQPTNHPQDSYIDGGSATYGRNEFRSGTVHSEGPLDRQTMVSDPQGYRQPNDPQAYREPLDQHGYRQASDQQIYRQATVDNQSYRQSAPMDQESNGVRDPRQTMTGQRPTIDYFDHYKRPPSRDSSVDRYGRRSRQASVEPTSGGGSRAGSVAPQPAPMSTAASRPASRAATPAGNGHLTSGRGSISRASSREHAIPFEESLLRKRTLGQEISPSPYQPKRTESLYVTQNPAPPPPAPMAGGGGGGRKMLSTPQALQRKKSLPDVAGMPRSIDGTGMSREEVSALGSARREEVRRMHEETEKLRANPLLYLVSPQVKDWFSRQQLVILVLFINISLGIMFFKLLT